MSAFHVDRRRVGAFALGVVVVFGFGAGRGESRAADAPPQEGDAALATWAAGCRETRPGLPPDGTRSPVVRGMAADPAATTLALLGEHVPAPPPDTLRLAPQRLTPEAEDSVVAVRYLASDGSTQEFASHLRPDDDRPLYWHGSGYTPAPASTFADAQAALVARVLGGSTQGLRVLGYPGVVDAGTVALRRADRTPVPTPWPRAWVFFVDDEPTAGWEHPCRVVFWAEDLSGFAVQYVRQPLGLVGLANPGTPDLFLDVLVPHPVVDAVRTADAEPSPQPLAINFEGSAQNCYAVIISGGIEARQNYIRYWEDSANIYSTLTRKYGLPDDHIIALVSDGTAPANDRNGADYDHPSYSNSPTDLDGDGDVDTDGPATFAEVQAAFDALAGVLTSNDQLFVFITDHGSQQAGWDAWACLWGWTWLRDDQLRDMTADLPCPVFFAMETCYSGGFVDDIASDSNRAIGAACAFDDTSEGWWHFDPWVYYLTAAFRGHYPDNHTSPWVDGTACDEDANADGRISFREAYDHAWDNRPASDVPQLGENPAGLANSLFLQHFHVELSHNVPRAFTAIPKDFSFGVLDYDWAAVGISPASDHDIRIDDNRAIGSPLKSSTLGGTARDFVVFNGSAYPGVGTLYAQAYYGATGDYTVEAEWDNADLALGASGGYTASSGEVFDLCETTLAAGSSYEVVVDVASGAPDLSVHVFRPSQWVAARSEASRSANAAGAGGDETIAAFVAPESGSYAILVVNENAGSGTFSVQPRAATPLAAPTGLLAGDGANSERVALSWNSVAGATHYRVYRNTVNSSAGASALNAWAAGTSYADLTATAGRTYYFWVKAAAASDGLRASDFSAVNSGYVAPTALTADIKVNTSGTPAYYQCTEAADYWWVVGVRPNTEGDEWDLRLYDTPGFVNQATLSLNGSPVNFVVADGNHLANTAHGVKCERAAGSGTASVEFESGSSTLAPGTASFSWPVGDVAKAWDVALTAGTTYRFTLHFTSGTADLNMALFGSHDAVHYKSRFNYVASSDTVGNGVDESFTCTAPATDRFGLCVWNDNANNANYELTVEVLAAGLWEGDVSTDWHTPGNWNDGLVPDAADDVTIPGGCPRYPVVASANGACDGLTVAAGASLTVSNRTLAVSGNLTVHGTVTLRDSTACKLNVGGNVVWEAGSSATVSGSSETYVDGNWNFQPDADVQLAGGYLEFRGSGDSWLRTYESGCTFANVRCNKSGGGRVCFSNLSTAPARIAGNLYQYADSTIYGVNPYGVRIGGFFNNIGGHFTFPRDWGCALVYEGSPTTALKPNIGDYLCDLVMRGPGTLNIDGTYTNSLVIYRDVVIEDGVLDANGVDFEVGRDWVNGVGMAGFRPDDNEVFFFGAEASWVWGDTRFCDFRDELMDDALTIVGNVVVTNWCEVMMHLVVEGTLEVDGELDLQEPTASLTVPAGGGVSAALFDMGGALLVDGGTFDCDELVDTGIDGTVTVLDGTCTLRQGTGAGEYVDLLGHLTVSGGSLTLLGGVGISYWPYNQDASLTLHGGTLAVPEANVEISPAAGVGWTSTVDGGTLRFGRQLIISRPDFLPTGGTCAFDGPLPAAVSVNSASHLHHVVVEKTVTSLTAGSNLDLHGDLAIHSGILVAPALIEIMGSWSNGVGTAGFTEGTNTVRFYGTAGAGIDTDETFYDLTLDKTYSGYAGLELANGTTAHVLHNLSLMDGTLEMNWSATLDVDGNLAIASGAGLNANDGDDTVHVGGNWADLNTTFDIYTGFEPGYDSLVVFDGGGVNGTLSTAAPEAMFYAVHLDRVAGFLTLLDSATVRGDLHILNGGWWYSGGPYTNRFGGDFVVEPTGAWYDTVSALVFDGTDVQNLDYRGSDGWLKHLVVEKNTGIVAAPLTLLSDILLLGGGSLTVREGFMDLNGHYARCTGNATVENGGRLWIDAGAWLEVGSGCTLAVQGGGLLDVRGSAGSPAKVTHHSGNYAFRVFDGAALLAENAIFEYMDANGLQLDLGAALTEPYTFHGCTFRNGTSGGALLKLLTTQDFTARKASFPSDPGGGASNVDKASRAGEVHFVAATGAFAGESYDNDPAELVSWHTGSLGGLSLDAPAVATMGLCYDALATATGDWPLTPLTYRWTVTDLASQTHEHDSLEDTRADCAWATSGAKLVAVSVSNELGVATAQQVVDVQVLSVDYVGRHWVGTTNAVDLAIVGTSADSIYRVQYRVGLTDGDWADAAPGGLAVPGTDGTTPWTDVGGPGRDVTSEPTLFYRAVATP